MLFPATVCQCWSVQCWVRNLRISLWLWDTGLDILDIMGTKACSSSSMLRSCEIRTDGALQIGDWSAGGGFPLSCAVGSGHCAVQGKIRGEKMVEAIN